MMSKINDKKYITEGIDKFKVDSFLRDNKLVEIDPKKK